MSKIVRSDLWSRFKLRLLYHMCVCLFGNKKFRKEQLEREIKKGKHEQLQQTRCKKGRNKGNLFHLLNV